MKNFVTLPWHSSSLKYLWILGTCFGLIWSSLENANLWVSNIKKYLFLYYYLVLRYKILLWITFVSFSAVVHSKPHREPKEKSHPLASQSQTYTLHKKNKTQKESQGKLHGKPRSARVAGLPLGSMDATTVNNRSGK